MTRILVGLVLLAGFIALVALFGQETIDLSSMH
jgi:hypothetical protein